MFNDVLDKKQAFLTIKKKSPKTRIFSKEE